MPLFDRLLETFAVRSPGEGLTSLDHRAGFILDPPSWEKFLTDRHWRLAFAEGLPRGARTFLITGGPGQWAELPVRCSELPDLDESFAGLFVAYPGRVTTVLAELHGSDLYGAERAHIELVNLLTPLGFLFQTVGPPLESAVGAALMTSGSGVISLTEPVKISKSISATPYHSESLDELRGLLTWQPDVLLAQTVLARLLPALAPDLRIPLIWWLHEFGDRDHGFTFLPSRRSFAKWVLDSADRAVANSPVVRDHFFNSGSDTVSVIGYTFETLPSAAKYSVANRSLRGGVVARLEPGKGHDVALNALQELRARGLEAGLDFYGTGTPRDVVRLKRLVQDLGLEDWVAFRGFVGNTAAIYSAIDFVVVASADEALGRVPIEAALYKVPVFFHSLGNFELMLTDGVSGIEFAPRDASDLAKKILAWAGGTERRDEIAVSAYKWWRARTDPEVARREWSDLVRSLRGG